MWIRRSTDEIAEIEQQLRRARFNPVLPILVGLGLGGLFAGMHWVGFRGKFTQWGEPIPFTEALCWLAFYFGIGFPIAYAYHIRNPHRLLGGTIICTHCLETAAHDAPAKCRCGGTREPLDYWRWQAD